MIRRAFVLLVFASSGILAHAQIKGGHAKIEAMTSSQVESFTGASTLSNAPESVPKITQSDTAMSTDFSDSVLPQNIMMAGTGVQANQVNSFDALQKLATDAQFGRPNLYVDPRDYGARSVHFSTTATCSSGSKQITLPRPSDFLNGDGVTIYGCGPNPRASAPSAPTVTSGNSTMLQVPNATISANKGSSTYKYKGVARDKFGGLSIAGTATTVTNGVALGQQRVAVSVASLSHNFLTIVTSANHNLTIGTMFHFTGSTIAALSGQYVVYSVKDATTIVVNSPLYTPSTSPITSAGGTLVYFNGNSVVFKAATNQWQIYVCAERPGDSSYHVIGVTYPDDSTNKDGRELAFADWGFPVTTAPVLPPYVTDAICSAPSPTPEYLNTTISTGTGTTTLTLAMPASQNHMGNIYFDNGPALAAAAKAALAANRTMNIPYGEKYDVYSIQTLNAPEVLVEGELRAFETIISGSNWQGTASFTAGQFAYQGNSGVTGWGAWPIIWTTGTSTFNNISINSGGNQSLGLLVDSYTFTANYLNCNSGSGGIDYSGMCIAVTPRNYGHTFDHVKLTGGPNQIGDSSWVPELYFMGSATTNTGSWFINHMNLASRGIYQYAFGAPVNVHAFHIYNQGGIMPIISMQSIGQLSMDLDYLVQDTSAIAVYAVWGTAGGGTGSYIKLNKVGTTSQEPHGFPYPFTGDPGAVPIIILNGPFVPPAANNPAPYYGTRGFPLFGNSYYGYLGLNPLTSSQQYLFPDASGQVPITPNSSIFATAPAILSGFGSLASIVQQNGTLVFEVNVGKGGTATSGVIGFPAAKNGWACQVTDMSTNIVTRETAFTRTTVTVTATSAWAASDKLLFTCGAF